MSLAVQVTYLPSVLWHCWLGIKRASGL